MATRSPHTTWLDEGGVLVLAIVNEDGTIEATDVREGEEYDLATVKRRAPKRPKE